MVDSGELPQPTIRVRSRPRWRWSLVIAHLEGKPQDEDGPEVDPFLEGYAVARNREPVIARPDEPGDRRDVRDAPETSVSADGLSK